MDKVPILIEGAIFRASLLILDKMGLDVILEMNWLGKHDGVIKYGPRTIDLLHPSGVGFSSLFSIWNLICML